MEKEARWHENQHEDMGLGINRRVFGRRLGAGDKIQSYDVYDSTSGKWEKAPISGLILGEGAAAVWVRPAQ